MAKKSKTKSNALFDLLTLIISAGVFAFLALPYVDYKLTIGGRTGVEHVSGYSLLNFDANAGVATVVLLTIIFAGLLALFAICALLSDFEIIKNKTFDKIVKFASFVSALAVLVMSIVSVIVIASECSANSFGDYASGGSYAVWYSFTIQIVLGLLALVSVFFANKRAR